VIDTGDAVPEDKASQLFTGPLESQKGLGVGLYQAARMAAQYGDELALIDNLPGRVRFAVKGPLYAES